MDEILKYELIKELGSGSFGYVFLAKNKQTNQKVAMKRIEKVGKQLSREYEILTELKDCSHCVKLLDCFYTKNNKDKLVQNMVFEFLDKDLEACIQEWKKTPKLNNFEDVRLISYQLFKGLEEIHNKNIVHRDLKPENVMMNGQGIVKLCDFGSSKFIDKNGKNTPYIVSRYYRAPELLLCDTRYSGKIDVWAVGCIIAELFTLKPLFKGESEGEQLFAIFKLWGSLSKEETKLYKESVPINEKLISQLPSFPKDNTKINLMFGNVSKKRELIDLLDKVFCYNHNNRITATEALNHKFFEGVDKKYYELMNKRRVN